MSPANFQTAWITSEQNLQPVSLQTVSRFKLNLETVNFLTQSGLPSEAAPFLSFVEDIHSKDKCSTISLLTEWFDFLEPEFSRYIVIGSDGSGNIIAIDTKNNDTVEWLDHEDCFSSKFMNTSIAKLANCLLCYREFVRAINAGRTVEECLDTEFTDGQFDALRDTLENIDERVVKEGFWKEELEYLLKNREDARSQN
jgi:hypothetical protein